jgi:hypothetical protein
MGELSFFSVSLGNVNPLVRVFSVFSRDRVGGTVLLQRFRPLFFQVRPSVNCIN